MRHGGDLSALAGANGAQDADVAAALDLSTGIAPSAYPFSPVPLAAWQRLPQSADLERLLTVARAAYGAPAHTPIVAAPGTQILIQLLPAAVAASCPRADGGAGAVPTAAIVGPTYSEHAICWRQAG
ncbi:MAG: hypothetical protein AAFO79_09945, partial [Pseudomonadota bacterium]